MDEPSPSCGSYQLYSAGTQRSIVIWGFGLGRRADARLAHQTRSANPFPGPWGRWEGRRSGAREKATVRGSAPAERSDCGAVGGAVGHMGDVKHQFIMGHTLHTHLIYFVFFF